MVLARKVVTLSLLLPCPPSASTRASRTKQMLMNLNREQWTQGLVMKRFEDHQTSNEKTVEVSQEVFVSSLSLSLPLSYDLSLAMA